MLIKVLHITLAVSLLTSSVGVVINQHFCQDELKRTALFTAVDSCHGTDKQEQPVCPYHQETPSQKGIDQQDCCHDSSHYLKSSQEQQMELSLLPVWNASWATPAFAQLPDLRATATLTGVPFYRPPPRFTDYSVHFQVFRL